jgi:hypothetical protein
LDTASFRDHGLWQQLVSLGDQLKDTPTPRQGDQAVADRLRMVASHVLAATSGLYSPRMLDTAYSHWNQIRNALQNHSSNPSGSYLDQADQCADQLLSTVASWPAVSPRGGAATIVQEAFDAYLASVKAQTESNRVEVEALNAQLEDQTEAHANSLIAITAQREALEERLIRLSEQVQAQTTAASALSAELTGSFNTSQLERQTAFEEELKALEKKSKARVDSELEGIGNARANAESMFRELEGLRDKTESVASEAVSARLARSYGSYANREFWSAVIAFTLGWVTLATGAFLTYHAVSEIGPNESVSWQWASLKLGLTSSAVILAGASFTLAKRFLANSAVNKRVELEIRAIVPFLKDIEAPDLARAIKAKFADRTFGHAWGTMPRDVHEPWKSTPLDEGGASD